MDEIFRSGTLEMSSTPLEVLEMPLRWSDVLTNRILVVVSMLLIMQHLLDLFRLTPPLLYSYSRSRGAEALEQSLGMVRVRNMIALSLTLPFCLVLDRFQALRPAYMDLIPAGWSVAATVGLVLFYLILRALIYLICGIRRFGPKAVHVVRHNLYNYMMLALPILLLETAVLLLAHVPEAVSTSVIRWTLSALWAFATWRTGQILHAYCSGFSTFLYLCALELLPAAVLVAVVVNF
jgi:hypothetical protein